MGGGSLVERKKKSHFVNWKNCLYRKGLKVRKLGLLNRAFLEKWTDIFLLKGKIQCGNYALRLNMVLKQTIDFLEEVR